jgi:ribosomal protein L11 methyltransferase
MASSGRRVRRYRPGVGPTARRQIVQVEVLEADAELAADALWRGGPSAVSEVAIGAGRVRLTADVADLAAVGSRFSVQVVEPDSDDHLDAWRAWATPQRAGRRILLQPAWLAPAEPRVGDVVVALDPGRTFGSGSHVSTRLVLAVLEEEVAGGERLLDVGCGSGVLAVTACLLGAASAVAVDVERAAVVATRANAERNAVADRVTVGVGEVGTVAGTFDVVVANIGLRVLRAAAPDLVARVRPGGVLVLAGLLSDQADEVVDACTGCEEERRPVEDGWAAPVLRRVS